MNRKYHLWIIIVFFHFQVNAQAPNFGPQQIIYQSENSNFRDLNTSDLDGDGDQDVVSAARDAGVITWFSNDGAGNFSSPRIITNQAPGVNSILATDLDGDGDADILAGSYKRPYLTWYANDGNGNFGSQRVISNQVPKAVSIFATDLDGDGDQDVLAVSFMGSLSDKVVWFANDGSGNFGQEQIIDNDFDVYGAISVYAEDLDGDGDQDVIVAPLLKFFIQWYRNDGTGNFQQQKNIGPANRERVVIAADVDSDGDQDLLTASDFQNRIVLYKNNGSGFFDFFDSRNVVTNQVDAFDIQAKDLDGDGDKDLLVAAYNTDQLIWFINDGSGNFSNQKVITTLAGGANTVHAADLDGDGDLDVLSASNEDDKIAWYENQLMATLTSFTLIRSPDNKEVKEVFNSDKINLAAFGAFGRSNFNIQANVQGTTENLEFIRFSLQGPINITRADATVPYAIFGNSETEFFGPTPLPGNYILTGTLFYKVNGQIIEGESKTIQFSIIVPTIANFTLIRTKDNKELQLLKEGDVVNMNKLEGSGFSIRANTANVLFVKFDLLGPVEKTVEDAIMPYSIEVANPPLAGNYALEATPYYIGSNGASAGQTLTLNFSLSDNPTYSIYPNTFQDELFIQTEQTKDNIEIRLTSAINGQSFTILDNQIYQEDNGFRINTSFLSNGHYILQILKKTGVENIHVIRK